MSDPMNVGPVDFVFTDLDAVLEADVEGLLDAPVKPKKVTSSA